MPPESLSPQLSSVESLRSSIPEKHRHLFDSLLQDIKNYCETHHLPFHLLSSSEAFTKAVGLIHPSLLEPLKLRMERLSYLTKHHEPMPEEPIFLTQEEARDIMGRNFLGTKEVEEHFGKLTPEQQEALSIIPFSKETLEECKDTHILVADIGLSISDMIRIKNCRRLLSNNSWYEDQDFAEFTYQPSWLLIRKTPVENSFNKTWKEQQTLLDPQTDEVPFVRQIIYTTFLYFLTTKERLFRTCDVRTLDVDSNGGHILIGYFGEDVLNISFFDDNAQRGDIGITSIRKALNLEI